MKKFFLLICSLALCNCAYFTSNTQPDVNDFIQGNNRPRVKINVESKKYLNDAPFYSQINDSALFFTDKITERFVQSNLFAEAGPNTENPDYTIDVVAINKGYNNKFSNILTGATLYLVPSWTTDQFTFETTITNNKDQSKKTFSLNEKYCMVQHITMIFFYPFTKNEEINMYNRIFDNMAQKAYNKMQ